MPKLTKSQLEELKVKHGPLHRIVVTDGEGAEFEFIVRKPRKQEMYSVASYGQKSEFDKANRVLVKGCVLEGDKEVLEDDSRADVYMQVVERLSELMSEARSRLEKI